MKKIKVKSIRTDAYGNTAEFDVNVTREDGLYWYDDINQMTFPKNEFKQIA